LSIPKLKKGPLSNGYRIVSLDNPMSEQALRSDIVVSDSMYRLPSSHIIEQTHKNHHIVYQNIFLQNVLFRHNFAG